MKAISEFRLPGLVLLEGKDDVCIVNALTSYLGISDEIMALDLDGKTDWGRKLNGIAKTRGFGLVKSLLLVRDSDNNPTSSFQSLQGVVESAGLPVPAAPSEWAASQKIRVACHLLPSPHEKGELEDLCMRSVSDQPAMSCVNSMADCVGALSNPPEKLAKFKVQAFLAAQPKVYDTLALGAKAGVFPPGHTAFAELRGLLSEM